MASRSLKEELSKSLHAGGFHCSQPRMRDQSKLQDCLLASFIPGDHDSSHFDSFLQPTINELMILQRGVSTACAGGQARNMKAHIVFLAGGAPAMPKILGFAGRNAASPSRFCHFKAACAEALQSICCAPGVEEAPMRASGEAKRLWSAAGS